MMTVSLHYSNQVGQSVLSMLFLFVFCSTYRDSMALNPPPQYTKIWDKLARIPALNYDCFLYNCFTQTNIHNLSLNTFFYDCRACKFKCRQKAIWNSTMKQQNGNILRVVHMNKGKAF